MALFLPDEQPVIKNAAAKNIRGIYLKFMSFSSFIFTATLFFAFTIKKYCAYYGTA